MLHAPFCEHWASAEKHKSCPSVGEGKLFLLSHVLFNRPFLRRMSGRDPDALHMFYDEVEYLLLSRYSVLSGMYTSSNCLCMASSQPLRWCPCKLRKHAGHRAWAQLNSRKYDYALYFSSAAAQQLEAQLVPEERDEFVLTWCKEWPRHVLGHARSHQSFLKTMSHTCTLWGCVAKMLLQTQLYVPVTHIFFL